MPSWIGWHRSLGRELMFRLPVQWFARPEQTGPFHWNYRKPPARFPQCGP